MLAELTREVAFSRLVVDRFHESVVCCLFLSISSCPDVMKNGWPSRKWGGRWVFPFFFYGWRHQYA